ncbi:hypothetical protein JMJ77_0013970 [Colletotrichum scovillei]|uniref:Uncharacterized protein n=1 Tax=Colletotrichum scovillei TaxID=1209932 RepID=A0A9P7UBJ5_9PEZI|nr:hypothetical protein JMJ77_0013970 [Colletotrichum scovillei]KAG7068092.1 hypothetical protein JMJ76_0007789 [Colletotrichum scovillei]
MNSDIVGQNGYYSRFLAHRALWRGFGLRERWGNVPGQIPEGEYDMGLGDDG